MPDAANWPYAPLDIECVISTRHGFT